MRGKIGLMSALEIRDAGHSRPPPGPIAGIKHLSERHQLVGIIDREHDLAAARRGNGVVKRRAGRRDDDATPGPARISGFEPHKPYAA